MESAEAGRKAWFEALLRHFNNMSLNNKEGDRENAYVRNHSQDPQKPKEGWSNPLLSLLKTKYVIHAQKYVLHTFSGSYQWYVMPTYLS